MKGARRFAFVTDNHGNAADKGAVKAFHEFCKWFKPQVRIHGGDCFDLKALRRGASDDDMQSGLADDLTDGLDFIKQYRPTHFLCGNHDARLYDTQESRDGKLKEYGRRLIDEVEDVLKGVPILPYCKRKGVLRIGTLSFIHGYCHGAYAAKRSAEVYGHVLLGHVHAIDEQRAGRWEGATGRTVGCLCQLDMGFNRGHMGTLRQEHGWAYGLLLDNGSHIVWQARRTGGRWFLPSEVKEIPA